MRPASPGPWETIEQLELESLTWVHSHNIQRLQRYFGHVLPAECVKTSLTVTNTPRGPAAITQTEFPQNPGWFSYLPKAQTLADTDVGAQRVWVTSQKYWKVRNLIFEI
jgi:hypothetical protein